MAQGEMSGQFGSQTASQGRVPSTVQEIPGQAEAALKSMRESVDDAIAAVTEKSRDAARYANRQVQANPWSAVGVGFGLGVLVGVLATLAARPRPPSLMERLRLR